MINTFVGFSYSKTMLCDRRNQVLFDDDHTISKQESLAEKTFVFSRGFF